MSAHDLAGLVDVWKVKRTELAGKAKDLVSVIFAIPERDPEDTAPLPDTSGETEPASWWQHYGFASRPPANAESLVIRAGATFAAIASRVVGGLYGKLGVGDVAMWSTGGAILRLNADASVTLLVPSGGKQWVVSLQPGPKGGLRIISPRGMAVEMSDTNGISLNSADLPLTLAGKKIQIVGQEVIINGGAVKLGMKGAVPLVGVGSLTPGAPNVFI